MRRFTAGTFALILSATPFLGGERLWKVDPAHTKILFSVSHMAIIDVTGCFKEFDVTLLQKNDDFTESTLIATIKTSSIDTDNERRDAHLRSPDFLYVEKYPEMRFESHSFEKTGNDSYKVTGDLTIRGLTKTIVLDGKYTGQVKDLEGNWRLGFKATTRINRYDFGARWNKILEAGRLLVGENVDIMLNAEFVLQKETTK